MARICDICEKGSLKGNLVPRGIGQRVTRRTIRHQMPNLRSKKLEIGGKTVKVTLCTSCLKRLKFNKAQEIAANQEAVIA